MLLPFALLGCQPAKPPPPREDPLAGLGGGLDTSVQTMSPETAVRSAPCAARLQNIGGTLLLYYATHQQMPTRLDDLKPLADMDEPLELSCPVSKKAYLYSPTGLAAVGKDKRIVVYDPEPSHEGRRWCLFMIPAKPGQALAVEVLEVPEGLFRTFLPTG